jgi:N6-L-threonylcarbamoyladenine synthase
VPEIASRHHVEQITLVIEEALSKAEMGFDDLA